MFLSIQNTIQNTMTKLLSKYDAYPWQREILELLHLKGNEKIKLWIYDDGNTGKSILAKHLTNECGWINLTMNCLSDFDLDNVSGVVIHYDVYNDTQHQIEECLALDKPVIVIANVEPKTDEFVTYQPII